jgi:hypothetical protein
VIDCVGRAPMHYFSRGPIKLLRRPCTTISPDKLKIKIIQGHERFLHVNIEEKV